MSWLLSDLTFPWWGLVIYTMAALALHDAIDWWIHRPRCRIEIPPRTPGAPPAFITTPKKLTEAEVEQIKARFHEAMQHYDILRHPLEEDE